MPLHLPCELVRDEVDRVLEVRGGLARPERHALQVERRLGDFLVLRAVLLLRQLEIELSELRDLLRDVCEALVDMGSQVVGHRRVPCSDLDPHPATLLGWLCLHASTRSGPPEWPLNGSPGRMSRPRPRPPRPA